MYLYCRFVIYVSLDLRLFNIASFLCRVFINDVVAKILNNVSFVVVPADNFALIPVSLLRDALSACELSVAFLFSILPVAFILATIIPCKHTVALFAIIFEFTFVNTAIDPGECA